METGNVIPSRIAQAMSIYPPFSMMTDDEVTRLASDARVSARVAGEMLFDQGDMPGKDVIFLNRGRVEYYWKNDEGSELVDVRDVGDLIGLTALLDGSPFRVSAKVVEDCMLYMISWERFLGMIATNDAARYYVRRHLFWATRIGGKISVPEEARIQGKRTILQAHLDGGQALRPRPLDRLLTCLPDDPIRVASELMVNKRVHSILVVNKQRHPLGIVTSNAVIRHNVLNEGSANAPVSEIMVSPVYTVTQNSNTTAAIILMMRERVGQICVTEDGSPQSPALDVCTHKDLLAHSGNHPAGLIREMRMTRSVARLREICDEIQQIALSYLEASVSGIFLGQICAELYDVLIERLAELAEDKLKSQGALLPKVRWSWISVGSDGRREQVLRTDMDNAMIFESVGDPDTDEEHRGIFLQFAEEIIAGMVQCGFSRCQGGVMASNPRWCRSHREWTEEIEAIQAGDGEKMLRAMIIFDLRHVTGDKALTRSIRETVFNFASGRPFLIRAMATMAVETPPPLNFWGKFIVEKKGGNAGELDIKKRALSPLRDAARVLAMHKGLTKRHSTGGRFEEIGLRYPELAETAKLAYEAYDFLLRLRTLTGLRRGDTGRYLEPSSLTKLERSQLSNVFDVMRMTQSALRSTFRLEQQNR